jgi:hypothetical protein
MPAFITDNKKNPNRVACFSKSLKISESYKQHIIIIIIIIIINNNNNNNSNLIILFILAQTAQLSCW